MSFQAYLENIKVKTGKTPEEFKKIAEKKGLLKPDTKAGAIVAWLKVDFGLGHGHAMAIYTVFKGLKEKKQDKKSALDKHFSGEKEKWRLAFDSLLKKLNSFGSDVAIDPVITYISILRSKRKFAIVEITKNRMDIGIKLKDQSLTDRFEKAGTWNTMMTHRVSIQSSKDLDKELFIWLQKAYRNL
jgi:predicted transport protein